MERLTDFKPLQRVSLPGLGELDSSGLILIVGPNSSGKTQLLQDLHQRLIGVRRAPVVAEIIQIRKPEQLESFLACLKGEGYLASVDQGGTVESYPGVAGHLLKPFSPEDLRAKVIEYCGDA